VGSGRQQRGRGTLEMRDNGFGMGYCCRQSMWQFGQLSCTRIYSKKIFGTIVWKKKTYDNDFGIGYEEQIMCCVWSVVLSKNLLLHKFNTIVRKEKIMIMNYNF